MSDGFSINTLSGKVSPCDSMLDQYCFGSGTPASAQFWFGVGIQQRKKNYRKVDFTCECVRASQVTEAMSDWVKRGLGLFFFLQFDRVGNGMDREY